jgi:hypothetical protein
VWERSVGEVVRAGSWVEVWVENTGIWGSLGHYSEFKGRGLFG